jgi:hypothetical protein
VYGNGADGPAFVALDQLVRLRQRAGMSPEPMGHYYVGGIFAMM